MEEELFLDERFVTVAKMGTGRLFLKHSLLSPDLFGVSGCGPAISRGRETTASCPQHSLAKNWPHLPHQLCCVHIY